MEILTTPPSYGRIIGFWLAALLLGYLLVMAGSLVTAGSRLDSSGDLQATVLFGGYAMAFAATYSLPPVLVLHLPFLPWALRPSSLGLRWARVFTLQSGALALADGLALLFGDETLRVALPVATLYFAGGLLAAAWRFQSWLWPARTAAPR